MKVRPSVKKICDKCKVVRRKGVVRSLRHPRSQQRQATVLRLRREEKGPWPHRRVDFPHKHIVYALPYSTGLAGRAAHLPEDRHPATR